MCVSLFITTEFNFKIDSVGYLKNRTKTFQPYKPVNASFYPTSHLRSCYVCVTIPPGFFSSIICPK